MKSLKIKSIKKIGERKTYNISVNDNHNFFLSNGILSHNSFGRIGSGKSVSTLSIIQGYHDNRRYKIWDLYGGERHEGIYWTIPSQELSYWSKLKMLGQFDEEGPKQYEVNLLYPYFESKLPKKLPKKTPYVNSKLFTIPLRDITIDDIRLVIGNVSDTSKYVWEEILHTIKKKDNCASLIPLAQKLKGINSALYKNFIMPMSREKFLMDEYCDYNIDIKQESKNIDVIDVLCLDFVPEQFHIFVINYIIRKLADLIDSNKIPKKNIIFIREAASFFRATEDSVLEDKFKIFRTYMTHYARMGRRGQFFCYDCQSAAEVRGLILGSEDFLLMFKTTSWRDKEELTSELKRERRMRNDQIADLAFLDKGEVFIAETGRVVKKVKIILPRTMFWKKEYANFYGRMWEQYNGEWSDTLVIKDYINEKYEINKLEYKEEKKEKKEKVIELEEVTKKQMKDEVKLVKPIIEYPQLPI